MVTYTPVPLPVIRKAYPGHRHRQAPQRAYSIYNVPLLHPGKPVPGSRTGNTRSHAYNHQVTLCSLHRRYYPGVKINRFQVSAKGVSTGYNNIQQPLSLKVRDCFAECGGKRRTIGHYVSCFYARF